MGRCKQQSQIKDVRTEPVTVVVAVGPLLQSSFKKEFPILRDSKCNAFRTCLNFPSRATLFPGSPQGMPECRWHLGMAISVQYRIHQMDTFHSGGSHWICWDFCQISSSIQGFSCWILPSSLFLFLRVVKFSNEKIWRISWINPHHPPTPLLIFTLPIIPELHS